MMWWRPQLATHRSVPLGLLNLCRGAGLRFVNVIEVMVRHCRKEEQRHYMLVGPGLCYC